MKSMRFFVGKLVFGLVLFLMIGFSAQTLLASSISGFIYDKQRNALVDVDVELLNEYYQLRGRTKTNTVGRYEFNQLGDGHYVVKVMPFRYDLEDQEYQIEINSLSVRGAGVGNALMTQDFYLSPRKGGIAEAEVGVIYAQNVPGDAKDLYKTALKDFAAKRQQEGVEGLFKAIQIFPDYFDALNRMGKELYVAANYEEAWRYFYRSTEVNPKSGPSYYYMGYCFHKLGKEYQKASITALTRASELTPTAVEIFFMLGKVERTAGKFDDAEKHLLQAKKLADKPIAKVQKELAELYGNDLKKYKEAADELELFLKSGKMSDEDQKSAKATILYLREKAKTQISPNDS